MNKQLAHRFPASQAHAGFTIVELLIATAVFSVILIICALSLLQVSRLYYKGIVSATVQENGRGIVDEIARDIQFSGGVVLPSDGSRFCVGDRRYTYQLDRQVSDVPDAAESQDFHALVVEDSVSACDPPPVISGNSGMAGRELLGEKMRLRDLSVIETPVGSNLYTITAEIVYGDNTVLDPATGECLPNRLLGQFCAITRLSTIVQKRVQ